MPLLEFVVNTFEGCSTKRLLDIVKKCELVILDWHVMFMSSKVISAKEKPNFRQGDTILYFRVKTQEDHSTTYEAYNELAKKWIEVTRNYEPTIYRPWLLLQSVTAFPRVWDATQLNVDLEEIALGTIPWPSTFMAHFRCSVQNNSYRNITANFFHDFKVADFYFGQTCKMSFSYANIRHILVRHDVISHYVEIYLNLVNPPLVYSLLDNGNRVVTLPFSSTLTPTVLGKSTTLRMRIHNFNIAQRIISRLYFRCGRIPVRHVAILDQEMDPTTLPTFVVLPDFNCTYLLKAIVDRNYIFQIQNIGSWDSFMNFLSIHAASDPESLQKAFTDILRLLDDGVMTNYGKATVRFLEYHRDQTEDKILMPRRTRLVAHVVITPTRVILFPPEIMNDNRVLRNFDVHCAIRVSFREDNLTKLNLKANTCSAHVFHRVIRQPMLEGLFIGDRHYEFLAWSNSQLRDHGAWMYARDGKGRTVKTIRQWMGDFSHIRNVPKFMARMGQCFSQTEATVLVPLDDSHVITVPDIVGGCSPVNNKAYCFSDGIGQISPALTEQVCRILELPKVKSAFQIRYAGYKGMLVLNPKLEGVDIVFRESMLKFPCKAVNNLEIVKASNPVSVYLNRQLITVLDHMDISPSVFLKLQEEQLRTLTDMLLDEEKAARQLAVNCSFPEVDFFELAGSGIGLTVEPFFRAMLLALHRTAVQGIKTKARIAIDSSLGRHMFGVLDETSTLEYGQVFVQYSTYMNDKSAHSQATVHTGWVLVTKNPCLQPGDVRVFQAIDVPELHHIVDAIVFPQRGPRPHPDEMAGSDLDGDEFTVIWHEELVFNGDNAPPEHYFMPDEMVLDRPIEVEDMVEFLCEYICNDQVGLLGNAHLAMADNRHFGLWSQACSLIAQKFSLAVDFAKNGHQMHLTRKEKVRHYPDFMEKGGNATSYRSTRILGKMYRVCRDFEDVNQWLGLNYNCIQVDVDLLYPGWTEYRKAAEAARDKYNRHLESILSTYGVIHESEAIAGAFTQLQTRLQERRDRPEVEEIINRSVKTLWIAMRKDFWEEFLPDPLKEPVDAILQKASAWYAVTYNASNPKYLSFPWIVAKQLARIKVIRLSSGNSWPPHPRPFIADLDAYLSRVSNQFSSLGADFTQIVTNAQLDIPWETLELATKLLLHWAWYKRLVQSIVPPAHQFERRNYIPVSSLLLIFLHTAATCLPPHTPMGLFIEFLRFCISLRFLNQGQACQVLPFKLRKSKYLGKTAMSTYHCIATEGNLSCAGIKESREVMEDEMEPVRLPLLVNNLMRYNDFYVMKRLLIEWTGVSIVHIREDRQSVIISAAGSRESLRFLRTLLQKNIGSLQAAFEKGILDV